MFEAIDTAKDLQEQRERRAARLRENATAIMADTETAVRAMFLLAEAFEGWPIGCECSDPGIDGCWSCEVRALVERFKGEAAHQPPGDDGRDADP